MKDFGNGQRLSTPGPGFDGWVQRGSGCGEGGDEDSAPESGVEGVVEGEIERLHGHAHYWLCSAIMLWAVVVRIFIFICR